MTDEAAPQEITEADWEVVREGIELFVMAVVLAWNDPAFSVSTEASLFRDSGWTLTTTAPDESAATRLPQTGFLVRGLSGTKVAIDSREKTVSVRDAVRAATGGYLSGHEDFAKRVLEAQTMLRYAVGHSKPLLRAVRLCAYGPDGAWKLEEVEKSPNQLFPPYMLEASQLENLVASQLERRGVSAANLSGLRFEDAAAVAAEAVVALRDALKVTHFGFAVIALLNGPPINAPESVVMEGSWYDRPFRVVVGYPTDALCSAMISRAGQHNGLFVPDHLGALNCFVRLEYEVPASTSSDEMTSVNLAAGEYVRRAVDVLRVLHEDDIGILYLAGFPAADDYQDRKTFVPPFSEYFPERPNMMYRTPMRRIFNAPSGKPLSQGSLETFGELFDAWALKQSTISGLPVAMERLRGIYDRYSPEEIGRLVDAVTALEALYLPDGSTSELKYRLITRAAWFLAPRAEDIDLRTTLARELGEIYDARSSLVHTGQLTTKQRKRDKELADRALVLLRVSVRQFLRTQFGAGVAATKLAERWMLVTMGESTLRRADVPPSTPRQEEPEVAPARHASSEPPLAPEGSQEAPRGMAKLHPRLEARWHALGDDAHRKLFGQLMTMSVPFWWHGPTPDDPEIYNNGTLCMLDIGARIIGVTAWHVYDAYLERLAKGRPFVCQFGAVTVSPEKFLIATSKRLDLATFDLAEVIESLTGFAPSRPLVWPPARPAVDDLVIYGGFPGKMRRSDLIKATFPLDSITGLVSQVTGQNLVIEVDYERLTDADEPQGNIVSTDPGGTSGGPVCRITDAPGLEIVGFIYEQSRPNRFVLARHADAIASDGGISDL